MYFLRKCSLLNYKEIKFMNDYNYFKKLEFF